MLVPAALVPSPQAPMEAPGWSCGRKRRSVRQGRGEKLAPDTAKVTPDMAKVTVTSARADQPMQRAPQWVLVALGVGGPHLLVPQDSPLT